MELSEDSSYNSKSSGMGNRSNYWIHPFAEQTQIASLADETIDTTDRQGNTALHYDCLGAKYETIALLLDKYDAVSVSRRNARKKLPIELLWESNAVKDRGSVEYTDSVFRLLKAFPETLTSTDMTQSFARLRF